MKSIEVEFCIANLVKGSISTYDRLKKQKHPYLKVKTIDCLGYCGRCTGQFFAKVDREVVQADTPDSLFDQIVLCLSRRWE